MPKKKDLGRALVRQNKHKGKHQLGSVHPSESSDWCRLPVRSITQETTLDDFFHTANLSNLDFTAQKPKMKVLSKAEMVGVLSPAERAHIKALMEQNKNLLTVLKRPKINRSMTKERIFEVEHEAYLSWRRDLAKLEEIDELVITPYERNLEFWRQLWQVVERSDVLIQVVDARQPLLFYSTSLNDYVKEVSSRKSTMVLINKSDFLTREQRKVWAKYFDSVGVRVVFFSALDAQKELADHKESELSDIPEQNISNSEAEPPLDSLSVEEMCKDFDDSSLVSSDDSTLHAESNEEDDGETSGESYHSADDAATEKNSKVVNSCDILSVDELISELTKSGMMREGCAHLTVGFLGYPNVGKSSTLNALCGTKKTPVSATPGKTKHFQTIQLREDLELCDCPGMVMPSFAYTQEDLVVAGILPIDEMRDCLSPIRVICEQIPREVLSALYGISFRPPKEFEDPNRPPTPHELLAAYACMRGFMSTKGNPHYDRAARIILKDYVKGRLRYCHPPPGVDADEYQVMGLESRFLGYSESENAGAVGEKDIEEGRISIALKEEDAKKLFYLSAYLAPTELHKLIQRLQRHHRATLKGKVEMTEKEEATILSKFDQMTFSSESQVIGGRQLVRSNKKLPTMPRAALDEEEYDNDASSTSSWSTVASTSSTTVGGASLLSGVSGYSISGSNNMGKKPWRQLSASKKAGGADVGRNRRKKEKLRRVYADLDRHEVE